MKVSIITINLNNKAGLKRTMESVVSQTYKDFEWLVIDGGSTDGSKELIEENAKYMSYWCSEKDKGIYNAMNKGILKAKGEYLTFLNSGDWFYAEDVLEKMVSSFGEKDDEIVYGDYFYAMGGKPVRFVDQSKALELHMFVTGAVRHQSAFIGRNLLINHLYDERYRLVSDYKWFIEEFVNGAKFRHTKVTVVNFEADGAGSNWEKAKKERMAVVAELEDKVPMLGYYENTLYDNIFTLDRCPELFPVFNFLLKHRVNGILVKVIMKALHIVLKIKRLIVR